MTNLYSKDQCLFFELKHETLKLEPWGRNSIRVRATLNAQLQDTLVSALLEPPMHAATITCDANGASLINGAITAHVSTQGVIRFIESETGRELLSEKPIHANTVPARHYLPMRGDLNHIEVNFTAYDGERLYGLGQHQHGRLDQKGCVIDLVQRNTEVSIPFMLSNRGYGFLWNNPAIGRVELGENATRWVAQAAPQIDYWITAGKTPAEILNNYTSATGQAPLLPEWATGYWQSRLRYSSQTELLAIAQEHLARGLPLSVIVVDFFHWTKQGDWQFDPTCWTDPTAMVQELSEKGVRVMVSVWATVNRHSPNFGPMWERGLMVRNARGTPAQMYFVDNDAQDGIYVHYYDPTNPEARKFIWERVREGYYRHGIKVYWLDVCEPEMLPLHPDNLRYHIGDGEAVANAYPLFHAQGFYEGLKSEGEEEILLLCRSAWAGSQRFGAAVWSGDIPSTFEALRAQVRAGLNMGLSGIPWWTTDIGGFRGGDTSTLYFRELIVRWFQYATFCPLFRLHGHRLPSDTDFSGGANEVWSFGEQAYAIIKELLLLRERLRPYLIAQMKLAHENGTPPMRPLFFDFPDDQESYTVEDEFMFGPDLLVAPIFYQGASTRTVYLPAGSTWTEAGDTHAMRGGQRISVGAPLERIPIFLRDGATLPIY